MRIFWIIALLVFTLCIDAQNKQIASDLDLETKIQKLYQKVQNSQYKKSKSFSFLPPKFEKLAGLYESFVKINFIDKKNSWLTHEKRQNIKLVDNNMFVTNFIMLAILDTLELGSLDNIFDKQSLSLSVDAMLLFQDQNRPAQVPIYNFWKQVYESKTHAWSSYPTNLFKVAGIMTKLPQFIQKLLTQFGVPYDAVIAAIDAFKIPADNDDTAVNLALGGYLRRMKDRFPEITSKWESANTNYAELYEIVKQYAYRPFNDKSKYFNGNSADIDPRTYYYLNPFIDSELNQAKAEGREPTLSLFTTWLLNEPDEIDKTVNMPFHTNNIDLTVNANSLFGLNQFLLTFQDHPYVDQIFDSELRQMYRNVTNLIKWAVESDIVTIRTDIALTYYPSEFDFYWFCSRSLNLLESKKSELRYPEMIEALETLRIVMRGIGTDRILNKSKIYEKGDGDYVYWEEFLGDYGQKDRHEDRLFATSLALNSLIDIWSIKQNGQLNWVVGTPEVVQNKIDAGVKFLNQMMFGLKIVQPSLQNVFFSGSVKTFATLPFFYPGTKTYTKTNHTLIDASTSNMTAVVHDLIHSWTGVVNQTEYDYLVYNQTWFGNKTPTQQTSFNEGLPWPFWSAPALTEAMTMLAFAKQLSLER